MVVVVVAGLSALRRSPPRRLPVPKTQTQTQKMKKRKRELSALDCLHKASLAYKHKKIEGPEDDTAIKNNNKKKRKEKNRRPHRSRRGGGSFRESGHVISCDVMMRGALTG